MTTAIVARNRMFPIAHRRQRLPAMSGAQTAEMAPFVHRLVLSGENGKPELQCSLVADCDRLAGGLDIRRPSRSPGSSDSFQPALYAALRSRRIESTQCERLGRFRRAEGERCLACALGARKKKLVRASNLQMSGVGRCRSSKRNRQEKQEQDDGYSYRSVAYQVELINFSCVECSIIDAYVVQRTGEKPGTNLAERNGTTVK
jgi:hypothetical protein